MSGGIDHLMINCTNYDASVHFYAWLMPQIGYQHRQSHTTPSPLTGFFGDAGGFWVSPADDTFNKERAGLREIAFRAASRAQVDEVARAVTAHGGKILDTPREYGYRPGYYAVFFADPSGTKLELVHYAGD